MTTQPGAQSWFRWIWLPFVPAGIGLFTQMLVVEDAAVRARSLALLLFCIELGWMARVDLTNVQRIRVISDDIRLNNFQSVVFSTIVLELLGFYSASVWPRWGALWVILSQLWFNLLAKVDLQPHAESPVTAFGIRDRLSVLIANMLALAALGAGWWQRYSLWSALGLLALIVLFLVIKYGMNGWLTLAQNEEKGI